ncbi:MAG: mercury(II) reductase, partial [Deltaproteobacteria bacterium]
VLARSRLLSREEPALGAALADYLRGEGIDVRLGVTIDRVDGVAGALCVQYSDERGSHAIDADHVLVALGRRPNTAGLGLADAGIATGPRGEILVDEHLRTTRSGVYAAGDVTGGPAFVYVAAYAGRLAAEHALTGNAEPYDLSIVPRVTFTDPALAAVGLTETEARARGIDTLVSELPMSHVPRAVAARDTRGVVKLVADAASRRLVGAHILAPEAGDIVQQAALAIRFGARIDDLARMLHPYLTNAEAIKLACQSFDKDVSKLSCCAA